MLRIQMCFWIVIGHLFMTIYDYSDEIVIIRILSLGLKSLQVGMRIYFANIAFYLEEYNKLIVWSSKPRHAQIEKKG